VTSTVRLLSFARSFAGVARDQQLTFLAAAIAYYAFVSVVPLVLVTFAVATALSGDAFAARLIAPVGDFLTPQTETVLQRTLRGDTGRGGATVASLAILLWSGLRVFRGLDVAFSRIYGVESPDSLLNQVGDAVLVIAAIGVSVGATVLLGAVLPLASVPLSAVTGPLLLLVVLFAVFFPLYYVFPDRPIAVREAAPGTLVVSVGWVFLGAGFAFYADRALTFELYGVLGGVLLALTWFYVAGVLLLSGATLNAVLAGYGDRQLQQGALRDERQRMSESEGPQADDGVSTVEPESVDYEDFAELRRELERIEEDIDDRTVHREDIEADLKRYVRRQTRSGHARGWGPYLVLLYGTVMTLGAFYLLSGVWAILAMLVIWLSTLGLYTVMVMVGMTVSALAIPGRIRDFLSELRS
jgi:membrane protein